MKTRKMINKMMKTMKRMNKMMKLGRDGVGWPNDQTTKTKTQSEEDQKMNNLTNESSNNKDQTQDKENMGKKSSRVIWKFKQWGMKYKTNN
jgi:hypothetical protein